ncbi:MAG TPA: putative N-acetylmannosamine-6-phosphate 2-epimerase [Candidatus Rubrimentiphilum sp.]|nr:putative N-acetylmannosamine-6-phosphate 2-epimerase [Candidatus Rubrimentiphilum sp.]
MSGKHELLERLRGRLIVSVQAAPGSALDDPVVLSAMAAAAKAAGAAGLRLQGEANIAAVRRRVDLPVIGIVKREYPGFEPYITPTLREVGELLNLGVEIVAFDATGRMRPGGATVPQIVTEIQDGGALAMADCALAADGVAAQAAGADIIATTLCGYTKETAGCALPALDLVGAFAELDAFVICEGGIHSPAQGAAALGAGAAAVVVGTAITNVEWLTREYAGALQRSSPG